MAPGEDSINATNSTDEEEALDTVSDILMRSKYKSREVEDFATRLSLISRNYDLNGDGVLDSAEMALRHMDNGDGVIDKKLVYENVQELMKTQKSLMNTKRLLCFVAIFAALMMVSIFGLSFAVAKLTDDTDIEGGSGEEGPAELVSSGNADVVVATVAEGYTVHHDELSEDPYGVAASSGSLFFPEGTYSTGVDAYKCSIEDYLTNAKVLGQVEGCRGIYFAAERSQKISFLSADEKDLSPGQSLVSVSFQPDEVWTDPIVEPGFSFYKDTVHMIMGTTGSNQTCRLLVFIEDAAKTSCPYYEIADCVIPDCIANPPEYIPENQGPGLAFPTP